MFITFDILFITPLEPRFPGLRTEIDPNAVRRDPKRGYGVGDEVGWGNRKEECYFPGDSVLRRWASSFVHSSGYHGEGFFSISGLRPLRISYGAISTSMF